MVFFLYQTAMYVLLSNEKLLFFVVASSSSCRSATFNSRSRSCQPTHMYMKDDLRRVAKLNRPASHVHTCSQSSVSTKEELRQPKSPRRFDGTVVNLPKFVHNNEFLTHEDLSMGQKQYIWGIARIYSMSNLMDLKQRQYQSLLDRDFHRNMQDNKLKENERLRERREYQRYTKFIKRYEQASIAWGRGGGEGVFQGGYIVLCCTFPYIETEVICKSVIITNLNSF